MSNHAVKTDEPARPPRLLDQVRNAIRRKHCSLRTEDIYVHRIKRFIYFQNKRHPRDLGEAEVTAFLKVNKVYPIYAAQEHQPYPRPVRISSYISYIAYIC